MFAFFISASGLPLVSEFHGMKVVQGEVTVRADDLLGAENVLQLQANETDKLCQKLMKQSTARGTLNPANPCSFYCITTYAVLFYVEDGSTCGASGSENSSICYYQRCTAVDNDDMTYCKGLNPKYNFAQRNPYNSCQMLCYILPDKRYDTNNMQDGTCNYYYYTGHCSRGRCVYY